MKALLKCLYTNIATGEDPAKERCTAQCDQQNFTYIIPTFKGMDMLHFFFTLFDPPCVPVIPSNYFGFEFP